MKKLGEAKLGLEGSEEGRWILIDYGDFVVHIFSPEDRAYYALEEIWGDAPQLDWKSRPSPAPNPAAARASPETVAALPSRGCHSLDSIGTMNLLARLRDLFVAALPEGVDRGGLR